MSIKRSLKILLIISTMIPVILISAIAHALLTKRLIAVQTQNLQKIAETNRTGLEVMLDTQITEISLLALQDDIQQLVRQTNNNKEVSPNPVYLMLQSRKKRYPSCKMICIYNAKKELVACTEYSLIGTKTHSDPSISHILSTGENAIGMGGISHVIEDGQISYTFDIGTPIYDIIAQGNIGCVVTTMNSSYFDEFLSNISIGNTGFGMLLDKDGTIIYHRDSSLIGTSVNSKVLSSIVFNYNKGFQSPNGYFEHKYDGIDQAFGYSVIPELDWVLFVKQDISEIRSVTAIMLNLLLLICAILFVLIIIFANALARKFTDPIIALRDAMRTAADGNLTVQSNIKSRNELGELSKNFNKMIHIIKTNYEDLSSMHEELLSNEEQLRSNYDHIEYLAYHDTLTNLPNKLAFLEYMNATLMSNISNKQKHAVFFIDLDNFKTINDTLGHEHGDTLLEMTARKLSSFLTDQRMIARAGGDEFLVFIENIESKNEAEAIASKIIDAFASPMNLNGEMVYVSLSIGISLYPDNGVTPNALIKNADIAMYKSKDAGKNRITLFDFKMEEELNRNTIIVDILRNAIDNQEIYVQYQPQFSLRKNKVIGYEALMRIKSKRLGSLSPNEFIPIAEETGLIIQLSRWLIREACSFNKDLLDEGFGPYTVSVNVSSIQLKQPNFVQTLSGILEETGLPPQYLVLELTESTLLSSMQNTMELLTNLQDLGVKISLDDFGTGYSSLNYLTNLPIDTLKIDKSFIDNICSSTKDSYIAETMIRLAHKLHIQVVAEGVETADQLKLLKQQDCDIIQGFIFSAPLHPLGLIDIIQETA
ncbi:MAG: EAL domain-containing protein [Clostridiales bacterium]|nr:EAL domain-containing protein [Clostridiales bacterium]